MEDHYVLPRLQTVGLGRWGPRAGYQTSLQRLTLFPPARPAGISTILFSCSHPHRLHSPFGVFHVAWHLPPHFYPFLRLFFWSDWSREMGRCFILDLGGERGLSPLQPRHFFCIFLHGCGQEGCFGVTAIKGKSKKRFSTKI